MIPILPASWRVASHVGTIGQELHRWLQLIARTISSTYVADQAPQRPLVIGVGQFGIHAGDLILGGTETITLESDSVLVVL
jgi:hypothetical protein